MQEHSQCQEGLWFLLRRGRFSDISQDGYTILHDTSSLVKMMSVVNLELFWQACCWCARAGYLFVVWVLNSEPFSQSSRVLQKGLVFRSRAKSVHSVGVLCLSNPLSLREGNSFRHFQGFRAWQWLVFLAADQRYTSQQPSSFFRGAMK